MDLELDERDIDPEYQGDKTTRLDIRARTQDGSLFNVEVQIADPGFMRRRSLYYLSQLYQGQLRQGQTYDELCPACAINVLGFVEFRDLAYHHVFDLRERDSHEILCADLQIHFLEVPKRQAFGQQENDPLASWMLYFTGVSPNHLEEAAMSEPLIRKAVQVEELFLKDERARRLYELREKARRDELCMTRTAFSRGLEEGEAKGLAK